MSAGTWYIFFTKWIEQQRILGQASQVEKKFWTSATLNEGVDKLPKTSMFRGIAEAGLKASTGGTSLVGLNDWIGMTLTRQLEDANARLQGGIAFLGSVGSVSPFVGLLGTVMGILNALIGIGVAGQASIDKVAGPVGEALIMTAIGLFVAVPAVLLLQLPGPPQQGDHREAARLRRRPAGLSHQQEQVSGRDSTASPEIKSMAVDVQHAVEDDEAELNVTINTTPLVDVMLVMLIIFLVTIPVIVKTMPVQLPTYRNIVTVTKPENIVIVVTPDETIYYNNVAGRSADDAQATSSMRCAGRLAAHKPLPGSAYPRRQECALRGDRPRHPGLSEGRHPESGLHHRTACSRSSRQLLR